MVKVQQLWITTVHVYRLLFNVILFIWLSYLIFLFDATSQR